ncbi:hypothetical protein PIB30_114611, partial [Stylosanthes scabra]|nr:hypothetical protein [Stylosanthes scabra]
MEAYRATYKHSLNPIPGEALREVSQYNKPLAPPVRRKPGCMQKKRRIDADEKGSQRKKPKDQSKLSRKYREFTCTYCGKQGHTKRSCAYKKIDDAACAEIAAQEKAKNPTKTATAENNEESNANVTQDASEIDITQPNYSQPPMMEEE